jgi:soluble lytic murein transglycosylase-like protein
MHGNDSLRSLSLGELVNLANKLEVNTRHIKQSPIALTSAILKAQDKILQAYLSCNTSQKASYSREVRSLRTNLVKGLTGREKSLIQMAKKGETPPCLIHQTIQAESVKMAKVIKLLEAVANLLDNQVIEG